MVCCSPYIFHWVVVETQRGNPEGELTTAHLKRSSLSQQCFQIVVPCPSSHCLETGFESSSVLHRCPVAVAAPLDLFYFTLTEQMLTIPANPM